jgi:protein gp37
MFRRDAEFGKDSEVIAKTSNFNLPIKKNKLGEYKLKPDKEAIFTCGTSDFFIEEADTWRKEAWGFMKERKDLNFLVITKRIHRFTVQLPEDWGEGYDNVLIGCTCENQNRSDYRLPIFLEAPMKHRVIIQEPMLEAINIETYLSTGKIEAVLCGGESGEDGRVCDFSWVLNTMMQCVKYEIPFRFKQTGTHFKKGDKIYTIVRKDQISQAKRAGIDYKM